MNYTGSMILFIFLVQLAAYTLKWLIGFGNPLISAPLLAMRLDNTLITPGSLLPLPRTAISPALSPRRCRPWCSLCCSWA